MYVGSNHQFYAFDLSWYLKRVNPSCNADTTYVGLPSYRWMSWLPFSASHMLAFYLRQPHHMHASTCITVESLKIGRKYHSKIRYISGNSGIPLKFCATSAHEDKICVIPWISCNKLHMTKIALICYHTWCNFVVCDSYHVCRALNIL